MERPTCKTCPFWQIIYENERKDLETECHNVPGECRRNAPKEMRGGGGFASSRYWCGEHPDFNAWIESQRKPAPQVDPYEQATHFKCKTARVVVEAFRMTKARRQDNRDWPEWLNKAWNFERTDVGAVFPTIHGTSDGTVSVRTGVGDLNSVVVDFGDWIMRNESPKNLLTVICDEMFRQFYEPAMAPQVDATPPCGMTDVEYESTIAFRELAPKIRESLSKQFDTPVPHPNDIKAHQRAEAALNAVLNPQPKPEE